MSEWSHKMGNINWIRWGDLVKCVVTYQGGAVFIMRYRVRVRCVTTTVQERVKVGIMVRG